MKKRFQLGTEENGKFRADTRDPEITTYDTFDEAMTEMGVSYAAAEMFGEPMENPAIYDVQTNRIVWRLADGF